MIFYVTGESYGGHYVPTLANLILNGLQDGSNDINIKGIVIGNPGIENDWYFNTNEYSFITFSWSHGLIPQHIYTPCVTACGWDSFLTNCSNYFLNPSPECINATTTAWNYLPTNIDFYDVLAPTCTSDVIDSYLYVSRWHKKIAKLRDSLPFYPCIRDFMSSYLNNPTVQTAIHVNPTKWAWIGNISYPNTSAIMVPYFQRFISQTDWRILIYSGDLDAAVPFVGTQRWIECLQRPITNDWRPWYFQNQTAGFRIDYQGISFMTIKGAGHMVPWYLPPQGLAFLQYWFTEP